MQLFSEQIQENVFNYLPITFSFDITLESAPLIPYQIMTILKPFMKFYETLAEGKDKVQAAYSEMQTPIPEIFRSSKLSPIAYNKRRDGSHTRFTMPLCHYIGHNLWLLKPANLNRGRGVHVFNNLDDLRKLVLGYCTQEYDIQKANQKKLSFVIQKYIESPLLVHERKFDIRMWVLVTHELDCYLFKEGYLRTSSTKFVLDPQNVDDKFVHLTNNAIQQYAGNYCQFEDGNQMSFAKFQEYLDSHSKGIKFDKDILPQIKNIVKKSILAVRRKLNSENRKYCFEIFGYDFIIDTDFNVWLIEINTNPCLEESSNLLKMIIPRMLDNAFKLTIDAIFSPLPQYLMLARKNYHVDGYPDDANMWYFYRQTNNNIGN